MAYFAEIDENGLVLRIIVAEQEFIDSGKVGDPKRWIQTYMKEEVPEERQREVAGVGFTYDNGRSGFIEPKRFEHWVLNETTLKYEPPGPKPAPNAVPDKATGNWWIPGDVTPE